MLLEEKLGANECVPINDRLPGVFCSPVLVHGKLRCLMYGERIKTFLGQVLDQTLKAQRYVKK